MPIRKVLLCSLIPLVLIMYPLSWGWTDLTFEIYLLVHVLWFGVVAFACTGEIERRTLLFAAVAVRVLLVGVVPFTTHDVGRYLWDGFVLAEGLDPYILAPDQLSSLAPRWPMPFDNRSYPSLYPPLAMFLFRFCVFFGQSYALWVWKFILLSGSLLTVYFLNRSVRSPRALLWIVLNPVLVLETMVGAHLDALVACSVAAAYFFHRERRDGWTGVGLAVGTLLKLNPILCFLGSLPHLWKEKRGGAFVGGFLLTVSLGYGIAFGWGLRPLGSLVTFYESWRFGSPWVKGMQTLGMNSLILPMSVVILALAGWMVIRGKLNTEKDWPQFWMLMLCAFFFISPVVFPWYLLPLIVLPRAMLWVGLWSFAMPFSYEVMTRYIGEGVWAPAVWPLWGIFLSWVLGGYLSRRWGKVLLE